MKDIKSELELTVEVTLDEDNIEKKLKNEGFFIKEELDYNDIYMAKNSCVGNTLQECILIRNIINKKENVIQLVYKEKKYNDAKEIIFQKDTKCHVSSVKEAYELLNAIGYHELLKIYDHIKVYTNGTIEFALQKVNKKHLYIELENRGRYSSVDEMKNEINKLGIPFKDNNYFVSKVEIELKENIS